MQDDQKVAGKVVLRGTAGQGHADADPNRRDEAEGGHEEQVHQDRHVGPDPLDAKADGNHPLVRGKGKEEEPDRRWLGAGAQGHPFKQVVDAQCKDYQKAPADRLYKRDGRNFILPTTHLYALGKLAN